MANLYLVRHGQAGFGKMNYDQLSDLGHQQAELVGHSLLARQLEAGKVVHGDMRRHRETMEGAQKVWHSWGSVSVNADFNEFDSDDLIACAFPQYKNKAVLAAWLVTQKNKRKAFQHLFAEAITRWVSGQHDDDYIESWSVFKERCCKALNDTVQMAAGQDVVVFTSGGPVTAIAQHCLGLTDAKAFDLNWMLVNAGITQLLYNQQGKISLATCNEQEHLISEGKQFVTYR